MKVLGLLLKHLPLKTAVSLSAEITGLPKKALYAQALKFKTDADTSEEIEDD